MTRMPNVWGTHSCAQFRAIVFGASIVVAVESAPAGWKAKLLELGFCSSGEVWYRLGALSPSEFEDLSPAITLVGFDYSFLRGGRRISEVSPVSPILANELQILWRRNQDAILLELSLHGVGTVWDAADCMSAATSGESTAPARALRKLAAQELEGRWHGQGLVHLAEGGSPSASIRGSKLIGLAGEPLSRLTGSSSDGNAYLVGHLWQGDTLAWTARPDGDLEGISVTELLKPAGGNKRLQDTRIPCQLPRGRDGGEGRELLDSLSNMHYGASGVVLRCEYGRLGLFFAEGDGVYHPLGITREIADADLQTALPVLAEQLLEIVTRKGGEARRLAPLLGLADGSGQGYLATTLKNYRSVAVMQSLRESGRGATLSDYEIDQLLWMLAAPVHSLASCVISVASGELRELGVGWFEDTVLSSGAVRSYVRGELKELQSTAPVMVHFSRSSSTSGGDEGEQVNYHASLQHLVGHVSNELRAGGFDQQQVSAGLRRLDRIATLPRAQEALDSTWSAERIDLQRWTLAEISRQLEGLPDLQGLDIQALAQTAADAVDGHQGVLISLPLYDGEPELIRVPWTPTALVQPRSAVLSVQPEVVRPAIRFQIDALRYSDPSYSELLENFDGQQACDAESRGGGAADKGPVSLEQEELTVGRADLWPRSDLNRLARACSGLHRELILGVWHGLPSAPRSADRLAIRAYRTLVLGMRQACESSQRSLERSCRRQVEGWLLDSVELICADQVVSRHYSTCEVYSSSLQWRPPTAAGVVVSSLRSAVASAPLYREVHRTEALNTVISHELLQACALSELLPSAGLRAAADILDRFAETGAIDWLWAWHACETHLIERVDWDLLEIAMAASRGAAVGGRSIDVRTWSAEGFMSWVCGSVVHPVQAPTTFFRIRRFVESVYTLMNLGTPAVVRMVIDRLQQK